MLRTPVILAHGSLRPALSKTYLKKKTSRGLAEITQSVKCLPLKYEDLGSDPQDAVKS